jgi:tRNA/tmRNA/rRNA uracil-C5-methylase (TrmA/RlmC/RlmD family)
MLQSSSRRCLITANLRRMRHQQGSCRWASTTSSASSPTTHGLYIGTTLQGPHCLALPAVGNEDDGFRIADPGTADTSSCAHPSPATGSAGPILIAGAAPGDVFKIAPQALRQIRASAQIAADDGEPLRVPASAIQRILVPGVSRESPSRCLRCPHMHECAMCPRAHLLTSESLTPAARRLESLLRQAGYPSRSPAVPSGVRILPPMFLPASGTAAADLRVARFDFGHDRRGAPAVGVLQPDGYVLEATTCTIRGSTVDAIFRIVHAWWAGLNHRPLVRSIDVAVDRADRDVFVIANRIEEAAEADDPTLPPEVSAALQNLREDVASVIMQPRRLAAFDIATQRRDGHVQRKSLVEPESRALTNTAGITLVNGKQFDVSYPLVPGSDHVNRNTHHGHDLILAAVVYLLGKAETVVDFPCADGSFTLALAASARKRRAVGLTFEEHVLSAQQRWRRESHPQRLAYFNLLADMPKLNLKLGTPQGPSLIYHPDSPKTRVPMALRKGFTSAVAVLPSTFGEAKDISQALTDLAQNGLVPKVAMVVCDNPTNHEFTTIIALRGAPSRGDART